MNFVKLGESVTKMSSMTNQLVEHINLYARATEDDEWYPVEWFAGPPGEVLPAATALAERLEINADVRLHYIDMFMD